MPNSLAGRPWISAGIFFLVGAILAIGGVWLIALGGSWYYLLVGAGVAVTGVLLFMRRIEGAVAVRTRSPRDDRVGAGGGRFKRVAARAAPGRADRVRDLAAAAMGAPVAEIGTAPVAQTRSVRRSRSGSETVCRRTVRAARHSRPGHARDPGVDRGFHAARGRRGQGYGGARTHQDREGESIRL
jgi:hypothetical protein